MRGDTPARSQAVILTASAIEYNAVRGQLGDLCEDTHKGTVYERGIFADGKMTWDVGIVQIEPGNANAAYEAQRAIDYFNPWIVLFVDTAYGLKDVRLGDVVAATKVYGYEAGKVEKSAFLTHPTAAESSYSLIQRAIATEHNNNWHQRIRIRTNMRPNAVHGPIAAGEAEIRSSHAPQVNLIRSTYEDALAVERAGSGFLRATHSNEHTRALIICGISELVGDSARAYDTRFYQELAAHHASAFAFEVLAKLDLRDTQQNQPAMHEKTPQRAGLASQGDKRQEDAPGGLYGQRITTLQPPGNVQKATGGSAEKKELAIAFTIAVLLIITIIALIIFAIIHFL